MFKKIVLISLLITILCMSAVLAETDKRTLAVSATGKVTIVPDTAVISLGVKSTGLTAALAQKKNFRDTDELISYLKEKGFAERKISLSSFNIYPVYDKAGKTITEYRAETMVQAKTEQTKTVAGIVDGAVERGANVVDSIQFVVGDTEKARQEALLSAIQNAKDKAGKMAKQLNVTLGKVLSVNEGYYGPLNDQGGVRAFGLAAKAENMPELPTGETEIKAQVNITYEIE